LAVAGAEAQEFQIGLGALAPVLDLSLQAFT